MQNVYNDAKNNSFRADFAVFIWKYVLAAKCEKLMDKMQNNAKYAAFSTNFAVLQENLRFATKR